MVKAMVVCGAMAVAQSQAVPEVRFAELVTEEDEVLSALRLALVKDGMVQVSGVPGLAKAREETFALGAKCLADTDAVTATFDDQTLRKTVASVTLQGETVGLGLETHFPDQELSAPCKAFDQSSRKFRTLVTRVSNLLFSHMTSMCSGRGPKPRAAFARSADEHKGDFDTLWEFLNQGEHLEHFHAYETACANITSESDRRPPTLEMHLDEGLFIALVPSMWVNPSTGERDASIPSNTAFYVENALGQVVIPDFADNGDVVVFMMGDGVGPWLGNACPPFRPVPHALKLTETCANGSRSADAVRMWYGRMFLPPVDAIYEPSGETFGELRAGRVAASVAAAQGDVDVLQDSVSLGCSGTSERVVRDLAGVCPSGQFYCWHQCRTWSNESQCSELLPIASFRCENENGVLWTPEQDHCNNCRINCGPALLAPNTEGVCNGFSTSMFMSGFVSGFDPADSCVVLLWEPLTLDTEGKVAAGFIAVFFFGMVVELVLFSRKFHLRVSQSHNPMLRKLVYVLLYATQVTFGYFAMLIAMTYSSLLFAGIVLGLVAGHVVFNMKSFDKVDGVKDGKPVAGDAATALEGENTDPCCQFMTDVEDPPANVSSIKGGRPALIKVTNLKPSSKRPSAGPPARRAEGPGEGADAGGPAKRTSAAGSMTGARSPTLSIDCSTTETDVKAVHRHQDDARHGHHRDQGRVTELGQAEDQAEDQVKADETSRTVTQLQEKDASSDAAADSTFNFVVQGPTPFSESVLWEQMRQFYASQGVEAWAKGIVPCFITCNAFIARSYAKVIHAYLSDLLAKGSLATSEPVYILELGVGSGKFSFLLLKMLTERLEMAFGDDCPLRIKYVMTDFCKAPFRFWRNHPSLKRYLSSGSLDFAKFDACRDTSLTLEMSRQKLQFGSMKNPPIVVANYLFDTLPADAFRVKSGDLLEGYLSVLSSQRERVATDPGILTRFKPQFDWQPRSRQADAVTEEILCWYRSHFGTKRDASFLIPTQSLQCLSRIKQFSAQGRMMVLSGDKGQTSTLAFQQGEHADPHIAVHGSFSLMVNYHAVGLWFDAHGGFALHCPLEDASLKVSAFVLEAPQDAGAQVATAHWNGYGEPLPARVRPFPGLQLAFRETMAAFGPNHFFSLQQIDIKQPCNAENGTEEQMRSVLAMLQLSGWDADLVFKFRETLLGNLAACNSRLLDDLTRGMEEAWANFFFLEPDKDFAFELGRFYYGIQSYQRALIFYSKSSELVGRHHITEHNIGLCHVSLGDKARALHFFEQSLQLNPTYDKAREQRNLVRQALHLPAVHTPTKSQFIQHQILTKSPQHSKTSRISFDPEVLTRCHSA
ncbi:High affinity copper uptake protein 1 (Copper transporter 1) (rCTR1) (Liver regeneration-related protein LRRGT00200) (Solute carrier family 31 member 1) [Durusdinium trenchii]|uniref:High affinity copper uptake protein 1 (Copper transporter 1) (RCTR1) (Liver regeneration-related protein LRRGT00200) (Solute carrier family 31 member 1) n=1 Tax=Durusdinium trenchii TaxID=1381693 RepID=A0ABP0JZ45_9DINO